VDALGVDAGDALARVSLAVWGMMLIFWVGAPVGGYFLYRYLRLKIPGADALAVMAGAFCFGLVVFAGTLLALLRLAPGIESGVAVGISLLAALVTTGLTALLVWLFVKRGAHRLEDHRFRVWGEEQRHRKTHRHKRR
jgi:hypothetical protein